MAPFVSVLNVGQFDSEACGPRQTHHHNLDKSPAGSRRRGTLAWIGRI